MFSKFPASVVQYLLLIWENFSVIIDWNFCFCLFSSCYSHYACVVAFVVSQILDILFCCCCFPVFFLCFSVWGVSSVTFSIFYFFFSSAMFSFLMRSSKMFFISVILFLISSISFCFFLRISSSAYVIHLLSAFSINTLEVLFILLKCSWSENSNFIAISESGSNACLGSSDCTLPFSMSCEFLLKGGHDVCMKRTVIDK